MSLENLILCTKQDEDPTNRERSLVMRPTVRFLSDELVGQIIDEAVNVLGHETHDLAGHNIYYTPGSTALNILDHKAGEMREADTADFIAFSKVIRQLDHIAATSTAFITSDVCEEISDSYRLFLSLLYCEKPVVAGAYNEIGKHLHLLTQADISMSDATQLDAQAGPESSMGATLAALAGINSISGPGMIGFESCHSLEKLAWLPGPAIDRANRDRWKRQGSRNLGRRLHDQVDELLRSYQPSRLPRSVTEDLTQLMEKEGPRYGQACLPLCQ